MIAIVRIALSRPYTFVVLAILITLFGVLSWFRTPDRHFPQYRHPGDQRGVDL